MGDQKGIENALYENGMPSLRMTFDQIYQHGTIKPDGQLSVMGRDISVVYFRTGYAENFYKDEAGNWCEKKLQARQIIESSKAIKCPSIHGQLTTFKKFQQAFSDEKLLAKYLPDQEDFNAVKGLF